MNKRILENENLSFINLYNFALDTIKKYSKIILFLTFISCIYFFIKTPSYSSSVSFYANYSDSSSQTLSSLSFIKNIGAPETTHLGFSISDYLESEKFLEDIILQKYNINGENLTLLNFFGENYNKLFSINPLSFLMAMNRKFKLNKNLSEDEKKSFFVKEIVKNSISYSEDKVSSLHSITITVKKYPQLSEDIVNNVFKSIIQFSSEVTNVKAKEKRIFVTDRLLEIKLDLKKAEDKLLFFLEKNKAFNSSPVLVLEKNRIERNIMLYHQLYISLADQLEMAKIDEKDNTSSIVLLDSPNISSYKAGRGPIEKTIVVSIIFSIFFLFIRLFKERNKLFIIDSFD